MRLVACIFGAAAVLIASFFSTWWLTEPEAHPQRLEDQRISDYSDLPTAAQNAGLRYSEQMKGNVDGFSRVNEREVKVGGWVVDPLGDFTPSKMFVFLNGSLVASGQTSGGRPDVMNALHLSHGAEKILFFHWPSTVDPVINQSSWALAQESNMFFCKQKNAHDQPPRKSVNDLAPAAWRYSPQSAAPHLS